MRHAPEVQDDFAEDLDQEPIGVEDVARKLEFPSSAGLSYHVAPRGLSIGDLDSVNRSFAGPARTGGTGTQVAATRSSPGDGAGGRTSKVSSSKRSPEAESSLAPVTAVDMPPSSTQAAAGRNKEPPGSGKPADADEWAITGVEDEGEASTERDYTRRPDGIATDPNAREDGAFANAKVKFGGPAKASTLQASLLGATQSPRASKFGGLTLSQEDRGTKTRESRHPAVDHIELFRDVLNQPGVEVAPEIARRLERHLEELEAGRRWVVEPHVHDVLQLPRREVRRMDAVMQRLEKKWKEALEEKAGGSPRGSAFDLRTELRRMHGVIGQLEGMWKESLEVRDLASRQSHDSSLDYSGLRSEN